MDASARRNRIFLFATMMSIEREMKNAADSDAFGGK